MYSFMGGGLFCAIIGNILIMVSTATDYWMQYRLSGSYAHQGLWSIGKQIYSCAPKLYPWSHKMASEITGAVLWFVQGDSAGTVLQRSHEKNPTNTYWNATRAFMILSGMACFAGIMAGILSFAHFSAFERFSRSFAAGIMFFISTLFVLLAMSIYTGVTLSFLGKRFGDWRFSWSYILGWVAMLMTFFAGIFYMCAHRMYESRRVVGSR
uniref:Lens intrinsic membrane protein 2.4 n=1 Tax=Sinocyclocheilus rhinocerous TaxID=307959 RepID=A0A673IDS1_9TELE